MNQQRTLARYLDSLPNRKIDETVHGRLINPSCSVALDDGGIRRRRLLKKKTVLSQAKLCPAREAHFDGPSRLASSAVQNYDTTLEIGLQTNGASLVNPVLFYNFSKQISEE
ncbi:hypothetical protein YC2023_027530 [Brassica napus]